MALEYWSAIGVQVEVNTIPGRRWIALLGAGRLHGLSPAVLGTSSDPVAALQWQVPGHRWNRGQYDDPLYNEWAARAGAAATLDERKEAVRQADYRLIEQHWYTWGPSAPPLQRRPALGPGIQRRPLPRPRPDQRRIRPPLDRPRLTTGPLARSSYPFA